LYTTWSKVDRKFHQEHQINMERSR